MSTIIGTSGDDNIIGTTGADLIQALAGNDIVHGDHTNLNTTLTSVNYQTINYTAFGQDTIEGGDGDDDLFGDVGGASVTLSGGKRNKVNFYLEDDQLDGGNGNDSLYGDINVANVMMDSGAQGHRVKYFLGDDTLTAVGTGFVKSIVGDVDTANVTTTGNVRNSKVWYYFGDDLMVSHAIAGFEFAYGDADIANTTLEGRKNVITYDYGVDDITIGDGRGFVFGDVNATLNIFNFNSAVTTKTNTVHHKFDNDTITTGGGNDAVYGDTTFATTQFFGGALTFDNVVNYTFGADTIHSGSGNDRVYGDALRSRTDLDASDNTVNFTFGNDIIDAGDGDDLIVGDGTLDVVEISGSGNNINVIAWGNDTMTGGLGNDTFDLDLHNGAMQGHDTITDLSQGAGNHDVLLFEKVPDDGDSINEIEDLDMLISGVSDNGTDVVYTFSAGGSLTLEGVGTGSISSMQDLVNAGFDVSVNGDLFT